MRRSIHAALWTCGLMLLAACSPSEIGEYKCTGGLLDGLKLQTGGKASVTASILGAKLERAGTYKVDGSKIVLNIDGKDDVFTKTGKTLDGGVLEGKCTAQ